MAQVDLDRWKMGSPSHRIDFSMEDDSSAGRKTPGLSVANSEDQLDLICGSRIPVTRQFRVVPSRFRELLEISPGLGCRLSFCWSLIILLSSYGHRRHGPGGLV